MSETEWTTCTDPQAMLAAFQEMGKASDRKLRLFAVALCRQDAVWRRLSGDTAEHVAEKDSERELKAAAAACGPPRMYRRSWKKRRLGLAGQAHSIILAANSPDARDGAAHAAHWAENLLSWMVSSVLRCIVGNPFQPAPAFNPTWRTTAVLALAEEMYESRSFDRMTALADALQTAGCTDNGILAHCRAHTDHVRGCWVIDLILGRY